MDDAGTIVLSGLTKRFGHVTAVDGLSFTAAPGLVTGFLGPNGAGKTTTLRMIAGLVIPDAGTATIGGRRYAALAAPGRQAGVVLEAAGFHPARTGGDHLRVYRTACGYQQRRATVTTAKLITYLLAGAGYALVCCAISAAIALPWLAARGIPVSLAGNGNLAVLGAVIISAALFAMTGAGLGALLGSEVPTVAGLLLYLYVAEPLLSHIAVLQTWTPYLPGVAADGLSEATQAGVRLLAPWLGGLVFAAGGTLRTIRRDVT